MKNKILFILLLISMSPLFAQDLSTPIDGNLFIDLTKSFYPGNMQIYDNYRIIETSTIKFQNNRIFAADKVYHSRNHVNATLNTDVVWIDDDSYVVLTGNSNRYKHGILGDEIESTGFEIYVNEEISGRYELSENRVFETLRPLIADIIPENAGLEIILTSSNKEDGARVEIYSQDAVLLGVSRSIGRGYRWLHVLGAGPLKGSHKNYLALVKTPHINGTLELLSWNGEFLESEISFTDVSTHQIGSSNLNMALLMNIDESPDIEIIVPTFDFLNLLILKILDDKIVEIKRFELPGRISTNIFFDNVDSHSIWVGLNSGQIVRIYE